MNNKQFDLYSIYYDLLYKDKNYKGEAEYVLYKLDKHGNNVKDVLELGMGTGIHAQILKKMGLKMTGVELSEQMAQQARNKDIECVVSDVSEFVFERKFDAVISLFHVLSYVTTNEKLIRTFSNVYNHLKDGGLFLFDVWYTPAVYNLKPETRIKRIENDKVKITRLAEPTINYNNNIVDVNYELFIEDKLKNNLTKINETHSMRHFSIPEIELFSSICGFHIIEIEEWMTGKIPSEQTWGILFILRKKLL